MDSYSELLREIPELGTIQETADKAPDKPADGNAHIRDGYHALSNAFGRFMHGDENPENATFTTYAAWATFSLRREVVPGFTVSADRMHLARRAYRWMAREILGADEAIGRNIVRGQAAVYEEIASAFYKMLQVVLPRLPEFDADPDDNARSHRWQNVWDEYTKSLTEMPMHLNRRRAASEVLAPGDVAVLQNAVAPYFQVLTAGLSRTGLDSDRRKLRAELILLGTIRTLGYEQRRVQPVYQRNFAYVPDALREVLAVRMLGRSARLLHAMRKPSERLHAASTFFDEAFQIAATRTVFSLAVGTEDVGFGRDIPLPPAANPLLRSLQPPADQDRYAIGAFFPKDLLTLHHRPTWAAMQQYDRSNGQGARTAVNNWLRYGERLNFLVNLFRSRQQMTALYDIPRATPAIGPQQSPALGQALGSLSDAPRQRLEKIIGAGA
jgi:hypothetical protein